MEFPDLGEHCSESSCKQLDFLPIRCGGCHRLFCRLHYSPTQGHACSRQFGARDNVVPECPICCQPIPVRPGEVADVVVGQHIDQLCRSQPAKALKGKIFGNRCQARNCNKKELMPIQCPSCRLNYCITHRNELDHDCSGRGSKGQHSSGTAPHQFKPSALAAIRRAMVTSAQALKDAQAGLSDEVALQLALAASRDTAPSSQQGSAQAGTRNAAADNDRAAQIQADAELAAALAAMERQGPVSDAEMARLQRRYQESSRRPNPQSSGQNNNPNSSCRPSIRAQQMHQTDLRNPHLPGNVVYVGLDNRYRGYPNGMMESPRVPVIGAGRPPYLPPASFPPVPSNERQPQVETNTQFKYTNTSPPWAVNEPTPRPGQQPPSGQYERPKVPPLLPPGGFDNVPSSFPPAKPNRDETYNTRSNIDEDIQRLKELKKRQMLEQELEQSKYLQQQHSNEPWRQPGAGSRGVGDGQGAGHTVKFRDEPQQASTNNEFHNAGTYQHKPATNTNPSDSEREKELLMLEKAIQEERQRDAERRAEIDQANYYPYGRPGGGPPNVTESRRTQLLPPPSPLPQPQEQEIYHPWGKGQGHPRRDPQGNVERYPFHNKVSGTVLPPRDPLPPIQNSNWQPSEVTSGDDNPGSQPGPHSQEPGVASSAFYPFGSPGGGAPNRDREGKIVTTVFGPTTLLRDMEEQRKKALAAKMYNDELEREAVQQQLKQLQDRQYVRAPIGELSEILRQGRTGKPKRDERTGLLLDHHLGSSDVTDFKHLSPRRVYEPPQASRPIAGPPNRLPNSEYARELQQAAEERRRVQQLERLQEQHEVKQHQQAFNDVWGRPGGGAPRAEGTRMINFDQALFFPHPVRNRLWEPVQYNQPIAKVYYDDQYPYGGYQ